MPGLLDVVLSVAATLAVGRVALSLLPPGRPGYHELGELPLTLATSWLLGAAGLHATRELLPAGSTPWAALIPWGLLAIARWATLPGALVPRHPVRHARAGRLELAALLTLAGLFLASVFVRSSGSALGRPFAFVSTIGLAASLIIVAYGLASVRRAPLARLVAALAIAAAAALMPEFAMRDGGSSSEVATVLRNATFQQGVFLATAVSFAFPFVRLADRRAGALAVALGAAPLFFSRNATGLPLATLAVFVVAAPAPLRARTALLSLLALGVSALPALLEPASRWSGDPVFGWFALPRPSAWPAVALPVSAFAAFVAGAALLVAAVRGWIGGSRGEHDLVAPPARETLVAFAVLALGLAAACFTHRLAATALEGLPGGAWPVLWPLVPVAVLAVALCAPPERVPAGR